MARLKWYLKYLNEHGMDVNPAEFAGHSLRRGGINAMRDACRAQNMSAEQTKAWLMAAGRWRSEQSLQTYLFDARQHLMPMMRGI